MAMASRIASQNDREDRRNVGKRSGYWMYMEEKRRGEFSSRPAASRTGFAEVLWTENDVADGGAKRCLLRITLNARKLGISHLPYLGDRNSESYINKATTRKEARSNSRLAIHIST